MTALRICPIDWQESGFRAAHWTTATARHAPEGEEKCLTPTLAASTQHFTFCPACRHAEAFARTLAPGVLTAEGRAAVEARWEAETERIFDDYTRDWGHSQRAIHRSRLWPVHDWERVQRERHTPTVPAPTVAREDASLNPPHTPQVIRSIVSRLPYSDTP